MGDRVAPEGRALLASHLARAGLFGLVAGWSSSLLGDVAQGFLLYLGCLALAAAGGWVLVRPMGRDTLLASAVLWAVAGYVYYSLRTPSGGGLLGVGVELGGYAQFAGVLVSLGIGVLLGRALARP
jgi:hypothetical protein